MHSGSNSNGNSNSGSGSESDSDSVSTDRRCGHLPSRSKTVDDGFCERIVLVLLRAHGDHEQLLQHPPEVGAQLHVGVQRLEEVVHDALVVGALDRVEAALGLFQEVVYRSIADL